MEWSDFWMWLGFDPDFDRIRFFDFNGIWRWILIVTDVFDWIGIWRWIFILLDFFDLNAIWRRLFIGSIFSDLTLAIVSS